jgi:hypothetical protein
MDRNVIGRERDYDPEPDLSLLPPDQVVRRALWTDDPAAPLVVDRRPSDVLWRAGLWDAALEMGERWQPTADFGVEGGRRIDGFHVTTPVLPATFRYEVHDTPELRELSDHVPVSLTLDLDRLGR